MEKWGQILITHEARGGKRRHICLIPASAQMAGMQVVETTCDANSNVEIHGRLEAKCKQYSAHLACVMIT